MEITKQNMEQALGLTFEINDYCAEVRLVLVCYLMYYGRQDLSDWDQRLERCLAAVTKRLDQADPPVVIHEAPEMNQ